MAHKPTLTIEDARRAQKLYGEITHLDAIAESMRRQLEKAKRYWIEKPKGFGDPSTDRLCGSPLQSVNFAHHTSCYSGPESFQPTITAHSIGRLVLKDILFQRAVVAGHLEAIGFIPPAKPKVPGKGKRK